MTAPFSLAPIHALRVGLIKALDIRETHGRIVERYKGLASNRAGRTGIGAIFSFDRCRPKSHYLFFHPFNLNFKKPEV
jgi:hypothetical protein